jgi:RHS repeat-associated protein
VTRLAYDEQNRLTRIDYADGTPGVSAIFAYDALGRRIERTVNGETTRYVYDGIQAIGEIRGNQTTTLLTGLSVDEMIARYSTLGQRVYLTDALGSIIAQTRQDQSIVNWYGYSPYGETVATADDEGNAIEYTARENDGTGLYFYRARYYDPVLKRFVAEDPFALAGGMNLYAYATANPLVLADPDGKAPELPQWFVDASAGFGDVLTFGLTKQFRHATGVGTVTECSSAYGAGEWLGVAASVATGFIAGTKAVARATSRIDWQNFSHSVFSNRFLRRYDNWFARWLNRTGNRLNGDHITPQLHTRIDPLARRGLDDEWLDANPLMSLPRRTINRVPYTIGAGAYGLGSKFLNDCDCQ